MAPLHIGSFLVLLIFATGSSSNPRDSKSGLLSWISGQGVFPDDEVLRLRHFPAAAATNEIEEKQDYEICETQECKKVAEVFMSSMDDSVDPCDDFYEFSCGGWSKDIIPPSMSSWSGFMMFKNAVEHRIKGVLELPPEPRDILPVRQAKKWYRSCMDTENLERRGLNPVESILMQAGGWPIAMDEEEWGSGEYTWQRVQRHYALLTGSYALFNIEAHRPSSKFRSSGSLELSPPKMTLSEDLPLKYRNYTGNDYEAYVRLVESTALLFAKHSQSDLSEIKLRKEAEDIVEFEKKLYELKAKEEDVEYDTMMYRELIELKDTDTDTTDEQQIDWKSVIQELFDMVNIEIDPFTNVRIKDVRYIKGIGQLLGSTSPRTIVNYLHWNFVGNTLMYTTEYLRDQLLSFAKEEYGVKERAPRWSECVSDMKMTHAASFVFVNEYFKKSTEQAALKMIKNVQVEMGEKIKNSNWLDRKSKKIVKKKLDSMKMFVGFPDWYRNRTAILNYYNGLTVGADYFDNVVSYMRYERKKDLKKYSTYTVEEDPWEEMSPITVNAFYGPSENSINLPAVNFQAPLFTPKLPDSVNYGIAGVTVGHEMGHAFDDTGILDGGHQSSGELSSKMLKSYYQRADCFTDQYENYYRERANEDTDVQQPPATNLSLLTRGENIADTTGIQAVFQAYRRLTKDRTLPRLPGLERFNDDQLFFISFAAGWCEISTPEYEKKMRASEDEHSPVKLRVIGSVSNTKDFARVFNCRKGSPMDPSDKCSIWQSQSRSDEARSSKRSYNWQQRTQWKS